MGYKLQVSDSTLGLNFNGRYENMANKDEKPEIVAKVRATGAEVKERTIVVSPGSKGLPLKRKWVDQNGSIYDKGELEFFYNGEKVSEIERTKVFNITGYQSLKNYTDKYIIDKYYELYAGDNDMKKDFDKELARKTNLVQMRKLWKHLTDNNVVARAEFCTSSRGFVSSDGYIRAVSIEGKWGLEIGLFKSEKVFSHLQEGEPQAPLEDTRAMIKRLKRV